MRTFLLNGQDSNLSELSLMVLETILVDHLSTAQYADVLFIYPLNNIKYCCKTSLKTIKTNKCGPGRTRTCSPIKEGIYSPRGYQLPVTCPKNRCAFTMLIFGKHYKFAVAHLCNQLTTKNQHKSLGSRIRTCGLYIPNVACCQLHHTQKWRLFCLQIFL